MDLNFVSHALLILHLIGGLYLNDIDCPKGWKTYQGSCYMFSLAPKLNWTASQANCSQFNAHLVTVSSARENTFLIQQIMTSPRPSSHRIWIGLSRSPFDYLSWLWIDGSAMDFTDWRPGQPDNSDVGEACGEFYSPSGGFTDWSWNDNNCARKLHFICEKEQMDRSSCFSDNGGCEHTCLTTSDGPQCKCKDDYISAYDGKICLDPSVYFQDEPQASQSFPVASLVLQLLTVTLLIPITCVLVSFYRRVSRRQRRASAKARAVMINPPAGHADGNNSGTRMSRLTQVSCDDVNDYENVCVEA